MEVERYTVVKVDYILLDVKCRISENAAVLNEVDSCVGYMFIRKEKENIEKISRSLLLGADDRMSMG